MTKLEQLESAVDSLAKSEYNRFRHWFLERDSKKGILSPKRKERKERKTV